MDINRLEQLGATIQRQSSYYDFEGPIGNYYFWFHVRGVEAEWLFSLVPIEGFEEFDYFKPDKQVYYNTEHLEEFSDFNDCAPKLDIALQIIERCLVEFQLLQLAREQGFNQDFVEPLVHVLGKFGFEKIKDAITVLELWEKSQPDRGC
ncbi:hypothetical protein [Allocoleopsis sp.]|uniref:hypothetical protein n=1 Tax=Allocoleopsis sp. TaxID=3088169 RepID=UPI002FD74179